MGQDSVEPTYERSEANEVSILLSPGRPDKLAWPDLATGQVRAETFLATKLKICEQDRDDAGR